MGVCVECRWRKRCIAEGKKTGGRDRLREVEQKNKGREERNIYLQGPALSFSTPPLDQAQPG